MSALGVEFLGIGQVARLDPAVFSDERGFFFESFNDVVFSDQVSSGVEFVQDNHSRSVKGVLRGLHYQLPPMAQGKLVRAVNGAIYDVAVDIRRSSSTFGLWVGEELTADNHRQLWVPPGFAHGFVVISNIADVIYKTTEYYSPQHDRGIRWDDPSIGIDWPDVGVDPILSQKDAEAPFLSEADVFE
jgi:dTDP-4-dehydrorhamnose 3,5-epimerase